MRQRRTVVLQLSFACALSLGMAPSLRAKILFDNGDPSEGFGVAVLSELDTINQVGDDFVLGPNSIVQLLSAALASRCVSSVPE